MGSYKILPLIAAVIFNGLIYAQEKSDPVAAIITSDSEATSVLGGWPPQKFGKGAGDTSVKNILKGTKGTAPKISDSVTKSVEKKSTVKKADPKLIAQTSPIVDDDTPQILERTIPAPQLPAPKPEVTKSKTKKSPTVADKPIQMPSALMGIDSGPAPLVLPLLPEIKDVVITPNITAGTTRAPRRDMPMVRSLYTLGPGDTVSFSTYDRADLGRTVRIAPDGTVSYLQAVAIDANGLTVDELRERMEEELQRYQPNFKLIVSPTELRSKEFAILGRVRAPGTFPLERPTTVLEGIALAQGVEIGTIRGSAYGLADFERSFVARKGRKLDVDFTKLYYEGDFSQNVHLQPNDYLYVASVLKNEFYILGAVNAPGRVKLPNRVTVTQAIALSGGFQNQAYQMKVLVIRGCINNPDVQVINVRDIRNGNGRDIMVEPRDIIFVARRPFEMVERVIDSAITTYVQTVTAEAINLAYAR